MELTIRPAAVEDAAELIAYLNRVGGESDNLLFGKDGFSWLTVEREEAIIRQTAESPREQMLVAVADGEIVSVASLQTFSRERMAHRGDVALSVRRDHWRQGIGRKMLSQLIEFGKSIGLTVIELQVRVDNAGAIALYQSLGFQAIGRFEKFFRINGEYFDALLMNLYL